MEMRATALEAGRDTAGFERHVYKFDSTSSSRSRIGSALKPADIKRALLRLCSRAILELLAQYVAQTTEPKTRAKRSKNRARLVPSAKPSRIFIENERRTSPVRHVFA